jgi:hypothetical protein
MNAYCPQCERPAIQPCAAWCDYYGTSRDKRITQATEAMRAWRNGGKRPSQEQRILYALASHDVVCGADLLNAHMPRYAAVIHRLRSRGFDIDTWACAHGRGVADYGIASMD